MKKLKFISAIALTVLMASCDDFELPNPPGQTNGEPTGVFEASDLVLKGCEPTIDLKSYNEANKDVPVATIESIVNFPQDYDLVIEMEVGANDQFDPSTFVATTIDGNNVGVNPDVFNGAIQTVLSRQPGKYDVNVRFVGYAVKGTTKMRLGSMTQTYLTEALVVTTLDPEKVLEDSYYILPCDANDNPVWADAVKMDNTSGNVSTYDNPEFAKQIEITEDKAIAGYKWLLAPQSCVTSQTMDGVLGCLPTDEFNGKLVLGNKPGVITLSGSVLITVNVEVDSYKVNNAFEALYPLSSTSLTRPEEALPLFTNNFIDYSGVSVLSGLWYLCAQREYESGTVYSQDPNVPVVDSEDGLTRSGGLIQGRDGDNLEANQIKKCLYWITVNLVQRTYAITAIKTLGVVGNANGWKEAENTPLKASKDFATWTAEDVEIDGAFKINANTTWSVNWGGKENPDVVGKKVYTLMFNTTDDDLNMKAPKGKYKVTVDFSQYPYTLTLE